MEKFMEIVAIVVSIGFMAAFVYVIVNGLIHLHKNKDVEVYTIDAHVSDKSEAELPVSVTGKKKPIKAYFVSFSPDGTNELKLRVTPLEYSQVNIGDRGRLSFRDDVLLRFEVIERICEEVSYESDANSAECKDSGDTKDAEENA